MVRVSVVVLMVDVIGADLVGQAGLIQGRQGFVKLNVFLHLCSPTPRFQMNVVVSDAAMPLRRFFLF